MACREQYGQEPSQYELALLPGSGEFALGRFDQGQYTALFPQQPSAAIRRGEASNHLELGCAGSTISASINSTEVASVQDSTYGEGQVLFGARVYAGSGGLIEARFDNLVLTQR